MPAKRKQTEAATTQTVLQTANKQRTPRPKGDTLDTDVMRHKQRRWLDKAKKPAGQGARAKAAQVARKAAGTAGRVGGPAAAVGQALGGPSQSQRQTAKQVRGFEKKNPGYTVVKTRDGFKTTRKPTEAGIERQDRYRRTGKAKKAT